MNSITRCPSCATHYQVANVDLLAAKGWLRCGQCGHVFDSTGLVLRWTPPVSVSSEPEKVAGGLPDVDLVADPADRLALDDFLQKEDRSESTLAGAELASFEQALTSFKPMNSEFSAEPFAATKPAPVASLWMTRYAVWVLALICVLQLMFVQRHAIASYWPDTESVIRHVCQSFGCEVRALRDEGGLLIDSTKMVQRGDGHVLSWTVRNTTPHVLAMTSIELTLMDGSERVSLRRVFSPTEIGAPEVLAKGQSWSGELSVRVDEGLLFTDYRLLSFYP